MYSKEAKYNFTSTCVHRGALASTKCNAYSHLQLSLQLLLSVFVCVFSILFIFYFFAIIVCILVANFAVALIFFSTNRIFLRRACVLFSPLQRFPTSPPHPQNVSRKELSKNINRLLNKIFMIRS